MYFMPRGNKLYAFIVGIRPVYRYGLTLLLSSIISLVWLFGVYYSLDDIINRYQCDIKTFKEQITVLQQTKKDCKQLDKSLQQLHHTLTKKAEEQSSTHNVQSYVNFIIQQAYQANLSLNSCTIENEVDKRWYYTYRLVSNFKGNIQQIINFFNTLRASHMMLQSNRMHLVSIDEHVLDLTCTFNIYQIKIPSTLKKAEGLGG